MGQLFVNWLTRVHVHTTRKPLATGLTDWPVMYLADGFSGKKSEITRCCFSFAVLSRL